MRLTSCQTHASPAGRHDAWHRAPGGGVLSRPLCRGSLSSVLPGSRCLCVATLRWGVMVLIPEDGGLPPLGLRPLLFLADQQLAQGGVDLQVCLALGR